MADKMLRIAGRGTDGTSKAIDTDNNGRINIFKDQITQAYENYSLPSGIPTDSIISPTHNVIEAQVWVECDVDFSMYLRVYPDTENGELNSPDPEAEVLEESQTATGNLQRRYIIPSSIFPCGSFNLRFLVKEEGTVSATIILRRV